MSEPTGFYELISRNKRNSWLLIVILILLITVLAAAFGYWQGGAEFGAQNAVTYALLGLIFASIGASSACSGSSVGNGVNVIVAVGV